LLRVIEANLEGARAGLDPEFLHDLRVATRRTRSALGQIRAVFPAPEVTHFKAEFAWLQQVTGPTRDLDVHLRALNDYRTLLSPELRADVLLLKTFLARHREATQAAMIRELDSARLHGLLADWRAFLEAPRSTAAAGCKAACPVREVANVCLRRLHRRVLEEGRAITVTAPSEALHELRKSCKKLRYLLEFFQGLYPPGQVPRMLKQLKELLDHLGGLQDLVVQMRVLRKMGNQMLEEGVGGAWGTVLADLEGRWRTERERFVRVFARFDCAYERRLFKDLLRSGWASGVR